MRVLVTGGAGFIGSHVVDRLRLAGAEVRIFDVRPSLHHKQEDVETVLGDIRDYESLRRVSDNTLRSYAHELLHFLRWWESVHHTDAIAKDALTESTLLDYVRFQSSQQRELTGGTIN